MGYELLLFISGTILIFISLVFTYRVEQSDDNYYLESELLSEIREIKQDIEQNLKSDDFNQLLKEKQGANFKTDQLDVVEDGLSQLKKHLDSLEGRLDELDHKLTTISDSVGKEESELESVGFKPEKYQQIKELIEEEDFSLAEVAHELDMGNREVDLIWKLNQRREE